METKSHTLASLVLCLVFRTLLQMEGLDILGPQGEMSLQCFDVKCEPFFVTVFKSMNES